MWLRREGTTSHQGSPHPQEGEGCCAPLTLRPPVLATKNQAAIQMMHTAGENTDSLCPGALGWICRANGRGSSCLPAVSEGRDAGSRYMRRELGSLGEPLCRAGLELVQAEGM